MRQSRRLLTPYAWTACVHLAVSATHGQEATPSTPSDATGAQSGVPTNHAQPHTPPAATEVTTAPTAASTVNPPTNPSMTPTPKSSDTPRSEWDPIVVTATRSARSVFNAPATVDTVTSEEISEAQFRTLPDVLRYVPGVMIQKTGHAQGSPYIRGFTGFRNLLLIDGIRLNNSVFRDGPNQYWGTIDPQSIDRLEVVKGPSSVLFGSDAIGGTVNVFTKGPNLGGETFQFGGRVYDRVSTAEQSNTIRGELTVSWDGSSGIYGGVTYANYGDLITASGPQPQTNYDELAGDFKLDLAVGEGAHIIVAQQNYSSDDAWRTHRTIYAQSFAGTTIGTERERSLDQDRSLSYIQFHSDGSGTDLDGAHLSLSYGNQAEDEDRTTSNGRRDLQSFSVDTIGLWGQLEASGVLGRWTTGFEFYHDDVDSSRTDFNANGSIRRIRIQGPIADDSTYDMAAVYVQNEIDATEWLEFITGARYTFVAVNAGRFENPTTTTATTLSDNYDSLVGSGRFVLHLDHDEHWNAFGGVSQAFRAPNLSDLTRLDTARSNEIETPAPSLAPENYLSYEVGLKTEYEQFFAQASWFWTEVDGMIIRQPTGVVIDGNREVTKRNSGDGFIQGFEAEGNWRFTDNFTLWGSLAWLDGEVDGYPSSAPVLVREPITRMMPLTTQVGLRWDSAKRDFWIEGVVLNAEDATELSASDRADTQRIPPSGTPGYTTLSLRSGYKLSHGITMTAVLDNVTDEDYRVHGSGINEAGLNFIFGLEWRF
jgi:hemoglobin/transferrin/lactoferrin receptor protein